MAPPDWFPNDHPAAPQIVTKGHGGVLACGSCHLMSGIGHPESADLAGMPLSYLKQQMMDFKSGVRTDVARMNGIAKEMSDQEIDEATMWFASLKPRKNQRVVEADMAPKTIVAQGRMRFRGSEGRHGAGLQPHHLRARGRERRTPARSEHEVRVVRADGHAGARQGAGRDRRPDKRRPRRAARATARASMAWRASARQGSRRRASLDSIRFTSRASSILFKDGSRNGMTSKLMAPVVKNLDDADILAISAYLATMDPTAGAK
jgi:cytochrome c553